jgi:hypothetical protein
MSVCLFISSNDRYKSLNAVVLYLGYVISSICNRIAHTLSTIRGSVK